MSIDRDGDGPPLRREDAKSSASRPDDLRATPFTDDVFDDDYYGRRGRGGPFRLIAGIIFGAAAAAVVGWYVLGTREPTVVAEGPDKNGVVRADPNPYKFKPEDPGGLQVENQDKKVYERLDKSAKPGNRVENLLPEPEQPKAPPLKKADAAAQPVQPAQPTARKEDDPLAKLVAKIEGASPPALPAEKPPAPEPIAPVPIAPVPTAAASADKPMTPANPTPAERPVPGPAPAADPAPSPALAADTPAPAALAAPVPAPQVVASAPQAAPAAVSPTEVAPSMVTPVATPGAMFLQLASARSEDAAMGEWKRISAKNGDLLTGLSPSVLPADLGDKGMYYRLRAGPVADKATAEGLCASLSSRNVGCIVVKP